MSQKMISKEEAKQLLERMIFEEMQPSDWAQDVWDLNPIHGECAGRILEAFSALIEISTPERLEAYIHSLYKDRIDQDQFN